MTKYIVLPIVSIAALLLIVLEVYWADWIIQTIFNKDFNNWAIFGALVVIAITTPKAMWGLTTLCMVLTTLYIWIAM